MRSDPNFNDFAHIPWEDTPNFPKHPKERKSFSFTEGVKRPTNVASRGYVGGILIR